MVWLWILAVIVLLTVLLCRTRVGAWAAFGGGDLRLDVICGLRRVHILPARPKKPGTEKPKKEKKAAKTGGKKPDWNWGSLTTITPHSEA